MKCKILIPIGCRSDAGFPLRHPRSSLRCPALHRSSVRSAWALPGRAAPLWFEHSLVVSCRIPCPTTPGCSVSRFRHLGFQPDVHYEQQTVTIRSGEVIVLYTDGITEAADPSSEMITDDLFGVERLVDIVQANLNNSAREIQSAILEAISQHTQNAPQYDDITLVIIKRNE